MIKMYAKFQSKCSETGRTIKKHDVILWDKENKKVFCIESKRYLEYQEYLNRIAAADFDEMVYMSGYGV
jgi:hypothetical protein